MNTLQDKLEAVLHRAVREKDIAGANLLVIRDGREVLYTQAGTAGNGRIFSRDTICRIYSMTKPVTAAAAMILVERGALDLGSAVGDILPAFRNVQVWENGKKTAPRRSLLVKDLLGMVSGLSYPGEDAAGQDAARVFEEADRRLYGDDPMTTMEWAERIAGCGLAFHPGERWMYGSSADVLGAVIEAVSGMPFGDFLKQEIFTPLGMKDTGFYVPQQEQHRLACVYRRGEDVPCVTDNLAVCYTMHRQPAFQSGGAGLVSTIDDYAKFAQSLLGHGVQILKPSTVRYMTGGQMLPWQQESLWRSWESMYGYAYSCLMRVLTHPGMALLSGWEGEYGWDGWLGTYFCNSPKNDTTVLMFCQRIDAGTMDITRKIRNLLTAEL